MSRLSDLVLFRSRRDRRADELSDEAMVQMLRAAADQLAELRALIQRIAIIARHPEHKLPGGAEQKLRAISSMLDDHGR